MVCGWLSSQCVLGGERKVPVSRILRTQASTSLTMLMTSSRHLSKAPPCHVFSLEGRASVMSCEETEVWCP